MTLTYHHLQDASQNIDKSWCLCPHQKVVCQNEYQAQSNPKP